MKLARKHAAALVSAGVMLAAQATSMAKAGVKASKTEHVEHRGLVIVGRWAETEQRRAPSRVCIVICPDVAIALIRDGWSADALRACTHTHRSVG